MEKAVSDLISPRFQVHQSPGKAGAHLPGLNKLFLGYSILVNQCFDLSCHNRVIGQKYEDRLILGPLVLRRTFYMEHLCMLHSDIFYGMSGAPKMTPF
jgi:hypothetical protein